MLGQIMSPAVNKEGNSNNNSTPLLADEQRSKDSGGMFNELSNGRNLENSEPRNKKTPIKKKETSFQFNFTLKQIEVIPEEEVLSRVSTSN